jgi:hydroxylaminobenzene mutase
LIIKIGPLGSKLILWGAILFLAGLVQGGLIPFFFNPRMALSAHLAAVQSGMALMIFGVVWELLTLQEKWLKIAYSSVLASMYLVWLSITMSAIFGASKALPMAGKGFSASSLVENSVLITVYLGAGLGVLSGILIVLGLLGLTRTKNNITKRSTWTP